MGRAFEQACLLLQGLPCTERHSAVAGVSCVLLLGHASRVAGVLSGKALS